MGKAVWPGMWRSCDPLCDFALTVELVAVNLWPLAKPHFFLLSITMLASMVNAQYFSDPINNAVQTTTKCKVFAYAPHDTDFMNYNKSIK